MISFNRPPNARERRALQILPANGLPMSCSEWMAALALENRLDVVGYLIARGWIAIVRSGETDAVSLSEQGSEALRSAASGDGVPVSPALAVVVDDPELAGMLTAKSAEIGERIAKAEDEQIRGVLMCLGLDPNAPAIREQVEVEYGGNGRKLLVVNGTPVAWIITEFPAPRFSKPDGPVDYRFTVRVEPYRVAI